MAEPSLLCVNCAQPPPPHRRTWGRCTVCVERNLPSTYYCGEECMNAHWPKHKEYHKVQKQHAEQIREGTEPDRDRSIAEAAARRAEATGDEYDKRFAAAVAHMAEGDFNAAAKAWRKIIKEWPGAPGAYRNLAVSLQHAGRLVEAAPLSLKAMELYKDGTEHWAHSAATAFNLLKTYDCDEVPKPDWWNDEGLKALSARVVVLVPNQQEACAMRAYVLSGDVIPKDQWKVGPRTAAEIKEAAFWYRRAAMATRTPKEKFNFEELLRACDEFADPLIAEEEAEAAKARAAATAEAAEALKVAEAKAAAAAEELLAEEENEKQQASMKAGKAKPGKGKKGKGKH